MAKSPVEIPAVELRQQAVPHRLRGDAGLVGDEKNRSTVHGSSFTRPSCIGVFHLPASETRVSAESPLSSEEQA